MVLAGRGRAGVIIAHIITTTEPGEEDAPEALHIKERRRLPARDKKDVE
jgi:hypothetical protein